MSITPLAAIGNTFSIRRQLISYVTSLPPPH